MANYEYVCIACGRIFSSPEKIIGTPLCSEKCKKVNINHNPSSLYHDTPYHKMFQNKLGKKLDKLREEGKDYVEEQKKDTINKFARINIEEFYHGNKSK